MAHWLDESENEPSAKIPDGVHDVTVVRVRTERNGEPWVSTNGYPQMQIIYQDEQEREIPEYLILTEKAAWKLRRLITRCRPALDTNRLRQTEADRGEVGKGFHWFHDQKFAETNLKGRAVRIEVKDGDVFDHIRVESAPPAAKAPVIKGDGAKAMAIADLTSWLGRFATKQEAEIVRTTKLALMNTTQRSEDDLTEQDWRSIMEDAKSKITKARPEADDELPF